MKNIGAVIKNERLNRNFTQKQVADLLGVTQDSISLWEMGKRIPDTQYIIELCKIFDISAGYLLGLEDDFGVRSSTTAPMSDEYTREEREIIEQYRELNPACKKLIKDNIKMLTTTTAASEQKKRL